LFRITCLLHLRQEMSRTVPAKSSSVYGARAPLDPPTGEHARRPVVKEQFYCVNGVELK
jgi:hypothetical protein